MLKVCVASNPSRRIQEKFLQDDETDTNIIKITLSILGRWEELVDAVGPGRREVNGHFPQQQVNKHSLKTKNYRKYSE